MQPECEYAAKSEPGVSNCLALNGWASSSHQRQVCTLAQWQVTLRQLQIELRTALR